MQPMRPFCGQSAPPSKPKGCPSPALHHLSYERVNQNLGLQLAAPFSEIKLTIINREVNTRFKDR